MMVLVVVGSDEMIGREVGGEREWRSERKVVDVFFALQLAACSAVISSLQ